ncbi:MAG TPA: hypothetical protein ENH56_17970 [Roseobacter sp.]|uniref:Uncharacterized protein n=1 Tax=marine sediment metagenome TaxID=412755 RepID=A0A0F9UJG8_9ZZZZ|nr:hypothetical protein [Roseobacter sp.]HEC70873.1 hypothetical protein [Roseobacter sp.]|tara:strand:- start:106 stop:408 length:303 start_codon:yes stop_codon:yes gene_type:complete
MKKTLGLIAFATAFATAGFAVNAEEKPAMDHSKMTQSDGTMKDGKMDGSMMKDGNMNGDMMGMMSMMSEMKPMMVECTKMMANMNKMMESGNMKSEKSDG